MRHLPTGSMEVIITSTRSFYKWDGSKFVLFQSIPTHGVCARHPFVMCGEMFLGEANWRDDRHRYNTKSVLLRYSGEHFIQTLLRKLFGKKGEILSWTSVKPCKNRKKSRNYYSRTREKSGSNSPPFQGNVQTTPSPGTMHSQMPQVYLGGGDVEASI